MTEITQDVVKRFFHYDPDTGVFKRVAKINRHTGQLQPCDYVIDGDNGSGYRRTFIIDRKYMVHKLIFVFMTGEYPNHVDHINGDKRDNRWENLRKVTHSENMLNKGVYKNSTTGVPGVNFRNGKYVASVCKSGKRYTAGEFVNIEAAIEAVNQLRSDLHFHDNHGKRESWRG